MSNVSSERNAWSFPGLIAGPGYGWIPPGEVRVADDRLVYRWAGWDPQRRVRARSTLLERFSALQSAPGEVIADFARTWGVLGPPVAASARDRAEDGEANWYEESLAAWHERAAAVSAAQRVAQQIAARRPPSGADWQALLQVTERSWWTTVGIINRSPNRWPLAFSLIISSWMRAAGLRLELSWQPPQRPVLEIRSGDDGSVWAGVVQALAVDLIGEEARYVYCANPTCGQLIGKTVASGRRRTFCPACREERRDPGAAVRVAALRERRRRVRELRAQGLTLAAIAAQMGFRDTPRRTAVERVKQLLASAQGEHRPKRRPRAPSRGT